MISIVIGLFEWLELNEWFRFLAINQAELWSKWTIEKKNTKSNRFILLIFCLSHSSGQPYGAYSIHSTVSFDFNCFVLVCAIESINLLTTKQLVLSSEHQILAVIFHLRCYLQGGCSFQWFLCFIRGKKPNDSYVSCGQQMFLL